MSTFLITRYYFLLLSANHLPLKHPDCLLPFENADRVNYPLSYRQTVIASLMYGRRIHPVSNCFYKNHRSQDFRPSNYLSNLLFLCSNTTTDSQNKNSPPAVFFGKVSMFDYIRLRFQPIHVLILSAKAFFQLSTQESIFDFFYQSYSECAFRNSCYSNIE